MFSLVNCLVHVLRNRFVGSLDPMVSLLIVQICSNIISCFPRTNEGANEAEGLAMGGCCKRAVDSKPQKQPEDDISDLSDYDDGVPSTAVPSISRSRVRWEARGCQRTYSAEFDGSGQ